MRYRLAAVFAGLALVVALAAGLAGRVPFGTVVARSLAGAVVFAGLGFAAVVVLERTLPELFVRLQAGQAEQAGPVAAEMPRVDIVLPEENPLAEEMARELEPADHGGPQRLETAAGVADPDRSGRDLAEDPAARAADAGAVIDDVDSLPGLEGLDVGPREAPVAARPAAAGAVETHIDPSLAARAVRTQLKRDHEG